ncbi:MAG: 5' nucleotidase, NT5C type [Deltaproteobacteria bacterium]
MRIGIDIDGVIVDTISTCAAAISDFIGYEITCEDVVFRYEEMCEVHDFWKKNAARVLCCTPPKEGVCEHINELLYKHELYFISSRGSQTLDESRIWFGKYGLPKENLFFTSGNPKAGLCKEFELDLFIEDSPKNAEEIADAGILVLLLDAFYNSNFEKEGIVRCKNWEEIITRINELEAGK